MLSHGSQCRTPRPLYQPPSHSFSLGGTREEFGDGRAHQHQRASRDDTKCLVRFRLTAKHIPIKLPGQRVSCSTASIECAVPSHSAWYGRVAMFTRLVRLQAHHPYVPLALALVLTVVAAAFAMRLRLYTGFEALLPEGRQSVAELYRVTALTRAASTVFVVLEGGPTTNVESLRTAADALVPKLKQLGEPAVASATSGVHDAVDFFGPRAGLFLTVERLTTLRDDIKSRYAKAVGRATGLFLDLDGDTAPTTIDIADFNKEFTGQRFDPTRYPGGYYQSKDGKAVVVLVRSKVPNGNYEEGAKALARIRGAVENANLKQYDSGIRVGYAGDLATGVSEFRAINTNLVEVGVLGSVLIAGVVLLYFMRLRTLAAMMITIGVGVAWTFGVTELTIGHLNIATGFLFTIVTGNGINFGIIYMARYLEARRARESTESAVTIAWRDTWIPTITAGLATGASYGSLAVTTFRGFHDFGFIGGVGMCLCWLATYWVLPPLLVVMERGGSFANTHLDTSTWWTRWRGGGSNFAAPFSWAVRRYSGAIVAASAVLTLVLGALGVRWVVQDPMEYDMRAIRTEPRGRQEEMRVDQLGLDITGYIGATNMAIVVERPEQVAPLTTALLARRDAAPADAKPFDSLHTIDDFVAKDQGAKIPILLDIRKWVLKARERGAIADRDWTDLKAFIPPEELQPYGRADLPPSVAAPFTEADGTRGRVVFISPAAHPGREDDVRSLFAWADSYRKTVLPDGSVVLGSGRAVIYADMWHAIIQDVPIAIIASFVSTIAVVLFALRRARARIAVVGVLIQAALLTAGVLALSGIRLNFLNFIALPVTFGIIVDYAVNIVERYVTEGRGSTLHVLSQTGGAVVLCSLTTTLGYLALVQSTNLMVRSMGITAFIGEACCLVASVLMLPALFVVLDRRKGIVTDAPPADPRPRQ